MKRDDMVKKIASYLIKRDDQICLTKEMAMPLAHRALLCAEKEFDFEWEDANEEK